MMVLAPVPLAFLVALGSILTLGVTAASNPRPPSVVFRDGLLSVEARDRPWTEVLEEVCEKTGIRCRLYPPPEGSVSASFSDLPLERALRRLFPIGAGVVFVYQTTSATAGSAAIPSEAWVLGTGVASATRDEERLASRETTASADLVDEARSRFEREPQAARDAALASPVPDIRLLAILHLGHHLDRETLTVLLGLLHDADPHIRQSAARALGDPGVLGELIHDDGTAKELLAYVMQTTEDPDIRLLAAETLGMPVDPL
jgi:HEAT repeats